MDVSILICTANRAKELRDTLNSLATARCPGPAELIVVDNKSTDATRRVVHDAAKAYPFPLRYLYEGEEGKYAALNAGIRMAMGRVIAASDDDARFEADWLERAVDGLSRYGCAFVGGRVLPLWGGVKPNWLAEHNGLHTKVVALLDHGDRVREFGRGISWPLGVNVAYRREVFERVGLFDNRLGRKAGTLRNQAQREWHLRARAAGERGFYLPEMVVHHLVSPERLAKKYFRRWLYWHGISRATLYRYGGFDMEEPELQNPPHAGERSIGGVPVYLIRKAMRSSRSLIWHSMRRDEALAFEHELWLCFFAGIVRQRWADRKQPVGDGPAWPAATLSDVGVAVGGSDESVLNV
ncbi:MAG TPA: glycosyltransferase [Vicinamibacterales bacterium]|jgi:glycosyltransferase involved in cell wall biosynthesis|nr:glycosyltransferase [Vicinamibacterales bacterium]